MVEVPIPETAPVMVLPECNFFPQTPLPLYIFEPRYRAMLVLALESDRMFCIGTPVHPDAEEAEQDSTAGVYRHGTIGLVRACVTAEDGTSNLLLEGLRRVRFEDWIREKPFRIATLSPVNTVTEDEDQVREDAIRLTALATALIDRGVNVQPVLKHQLQSGVDPEMLTDLISNYMLMDIHKRHRLLHMGCLNERMGFLIRELKGMLGSLGPPPK